MLNPARVEQLTGLRFFAALGVLLCHFHVLIPNAAPKFLFDLGGHGVTLFFVLSGFVLTWRYDAPHQISTGKTRTGQLPRINLAAFAAARFARIAPVYWLALVMVVATYATLGPGPAMSTPPPTVVQGLGGLLLNVVALQAWVPSEHVQQFWNAPGWSISAEVFFYCCFPWLLRLRWLSGSPWSLALITGVFSVSLGLYLWILQASGHWGAMGLAFAARLPLLGLWPFVMGMLCCRLLRRNPHWPTHKGGWTLLAFALLVVVAWATGAWAPPEAPHLALLLVSHLLYVPLFTVLIVCLVLDHGPLARFLSSPPLVLLGHASYALYLLHWLPLGAAVWWLDDTPAPLWAVSMGIGGLVALSLMVYHWFETPMRLRLVAGLQGRRPNVSRVT